MYNISGVSIFSSEKLIETKVLNKLCPFYAPFPLKLAPSSSGSSHF